jgi:hypothetical protein
MTVGILTPTQDKSRYEIFKKKKEWFEIVPFENNAKHH